MSSPEHKKKIWNIIRDIKVAMMVTKEQDTLVSRPMHLVQDAYDGTLWFFTDKSTEKVEEINKYPDVCLTFSDVNNGTYVTLSGKASITTDPKLIEKYWNTFSSAWFPEGKNDPNVAMLEVKIQKGQHWDSDSKIVQLFSLAKANITGEQPNMGESEAFGT